MRRKRFAYLLLLAPLATTVACTAILGDFNVGSNGATDSGTSDGANNNTDGNSTLQDSGGNVTDSSMLDGGDGGIKCGFPGEACCGGGFLPCNAGTACVSNVCKLNDVWIVGTYTENIFTNVGASIHYDGNSWTKGPEIPMTTTSQQSNPYPTSLWGTPVNEYEGVTAAGYVFTFTPGTPPSWRNCSPTAAPCPGQPANPPVQALWGIYGFGGSDYWVAGTNVMYHCSESACVSTITGLPATWGQGTFTGTSSKDLWYPQFDRAFHYDGMTWTVTTGIQARAMWAASPKDVWGADSTLQHFDGTNWSTPYVIDQPDGAPAGTIYAISGTASNDVWAVGFEQVSGNNVPFSGHWDGTKWTYVPVPSAVGQVQALWAGAPNEVFLLGAFGPIYEWTGSAWNAVAQPPMSVYPDASSSPSWDFVTGIARPRPAN